MITILLTPRSCCGVMPMSGIGLAMSIQSASVSATAVRCSWISFSMNVS